jgi:hypothetical protein
MFLGPIAARRKARRIACPTIRLAGGHPVIQTSAASGTLSSVEKKPADDLATAPVEPQRTALYVPLDHEAVVPSVKSREPFPALVRMFDDHLPSMLRTRAQLSGMADLCQVPDEPVDDVSPYWNNGFFTGYDASAAYAFTRVRKPARIVEIGSGNSTRFFRKAINEGKLATRLVSIDPYPRVEVERIADEVMRVSLLDVPLSTFASLRPGDILFFDGSHLCFHGSDVTHFFLSVLPAVPCGVIVHIHDIYLPCEYPEHFDERYYNEQYILAAFLMCNRDWRVLLPVHFLAYRGVMDTDGGSFWMERTDAAGVRGPRFFAGKRWPIWSR